MGIFSKLSKGFGSGLLASLEQRMREEQSLRTQRLTGKFKQEEEDRLRKLGIGVGKLRMGVDGSEDVEDALGPDEAETYLSLLTINASSDAEKLVDDLVSFVIATRKCTHKDWIKGHQFRWLVIFGHYLGPLQFIARAMKKIYNINYKDFYTDLLSFCEKKSNTYIGKEYLTIKKNLNKILKNKRHWGDVFTGVGYINGEVDEAT